MSEPTPSQSGLFRIISAASVGTLIEWYDFYIFGALTPIIAKQFFPSGNDTAAFLAALATFAAGFVVRPFGALVFGRLGDLVGRKYTFLVTLLIMGGATFVIGLVPGYQSWGLAAPILILLLRLLQGLALGGEYGGAATYVAEYAPAERRGFYTSFIQTTATLGFFLSLGVILLTRRQVGVTAFGEWGWRVPFLVSAVLIAVSVYIRLRMAESPLFAEIKREGKISANPLKESFGRKDNLKMVLLALFGTVMGQGVVWYTGQFYAQTFIERTCGVEFEQTRYLLCIAILVATPFFVVFGWWSDRVGRLPIILGGMALAVLSYYPIYRAIYWITDPKAKREIVADFKEANTLTINEKTGDSTRTFTIWRTFNDSTVMRWDAKMFHLKDPNATPPKPEKIKTVYLPPLKFWLLALLVLVQILFVTMVYGPIAAYLVELFPTRIRYTSMSLPYHIGNGIFGGLTPFIATRFFDMSKTADLPGGDPFVGLWYPIGVGALCVLIGLSHSMSIGSGQNRRFLGWLWMGVAAAVTGALLYLAWHGLGLDKSIDNKMFWGIVLPIFTPIMAGLGLFGWYVWRREYSD